MDAAATAAPKVAGAATVVTKAEKWGKCAQTKLDDAKKILVAAQEAEKTAKPVDKIVASANV